VLGVADEFEIIVKTGFANTSPIRKVHHVTVFSLPITDYVYSAAFFTHCAFAQADAI